MTTRGAKYGIEGFLRNLFSVKKEVKTRKIFVNLNRNSSDSKRDNFCMSNNKYQIEYRKIEHCALFGTHPVVCIHLFVVCIKLFVVHIIYKPIWSLHAVYFNLIVIYIILFIV